MKLARLFFQLFFLLVLILIGGQIKAQYQFRVTKATDKALPVTAKGIYYALPKTTFKVKLVLEEINHIRGPFAQYTTKYLGTNDFIKADGHYLRLLAVDVEPIQMADPKQVYFIQFPEDKSSKETRKYAFQLNDEGVLIGIGLQTNQQSQKRRSAASSSQTFVYSDNTQGFKMAAGYSRAQKVDTIVRKFTIDTLTIKRFLYKTSWINLSEEARADDAAQQIKKIRDSRFNLLTGYQEVNYGEGIRYMDAELQKMERQYLALFLGRETKQMVVRSFEFDPGKGKLTKHLMQYKDANGELQSIQLKITPDNTLSLPASPQAKPDFVFYRIPVKATVQILLGSQPFYSNVFNLPQLGVVSITSMENARLRFDSHTGTLISFDRK